MVALVATVVIAEKVDPEEEEDTLEVEDIPEAVVEVDHTVKDGEMIIVVAMAEEATVEEDMTKVTVTKDMITRDPLVVAMVVDIIIIMVAMEDTEAKMEDMDMTIMVVVDQEKVDMAVEDMREMLRDQNWILAKFKVLMEIMTLNMVQSILKLAILAKYLEMVEKQELKVIMMRILDQSRRTQSKILVNRRS